MNDSLPVQVAAQLRGAHARLASSPVMLGFDGFVDTILHVVAVRESAKKFTRMGGMRTFAKRIDAAAGFSANFEMVTQQVKLGGNGPIMANALASYGTPVTYLGNLGAPVIHPVFADLARRAKVYSVAEPAQTDAIEFEDGKLMCGKNESLKKVDWAALIAQVPEPQLLKIFSASALIAMVNWTMLPHMTAIWQKIATRIAPQLTGEKRWLFFDLADPAKRTREDLARALKQIAKFEKYFRVNFGLNLAESRQVGEILGLAAPDETYGTVTQHAAQLREALQIDTVVIHATQFAAAANASGSSYVVGPYTPVPKITTGAGDHFNAGFCTGRLLGLDLPASLQLAVATSGYYVREAKSPRIEDVRKFLKALATS